MRACTQFVHCDMMRGARWTRRKAAPLSVSPGECLALRLGVHRLIRSRAPLIPTLLLDDVFSEPFSSRSAALAAAKRVAAEQHVPGDTTHIEYQDDAGAWHSELSEGDDRPDADVVA